MNDSKPMATGLRKRVVINSSQQQNETHSHSKSLETPILRKQMKVLLDHTTSPEEMALSPRRCRAAAAPQSQGGGLPRRCRVPHLWLSTRNRLAARRTNPASQDVQTAGWHICPLRTHIRRSAEATDLSESGRSRRTAFRIQAK